MSEPDEKGKITADIAQEVIDAAVRAVESHTSGEVEAKPEEASEAAPAEAELASLKAQLEVSQAAGRELLEKLKAEHERVLRATADLENYRKRAAKEREEIQKFGVERLLKDFLPIIDNLDRAVEHSRAAADPAGLAEGVAMTRKLFEDTLARHGVKPFSAVGRPFDPAMHEAMQQLETDLVPAGQVVQEILRGYTLNERLVRPALVVVAKAQSPIEQSETTGQSTGTES